MESGNRTLSALISKVGKAAEVRDHVVDEAHLAAYQAIQKLGQELISALDGKPLRGVVNLATNRHPFYGAQLRKKDPLKPLVKHERSLCVNVRGEFVMATLRSKRQGNTWLTTEPARYEDFQAEDTDRVPKALFCILKLHVERAKESEERFRKLRGMAERILA